MNPYDKVNELIESIKSSDEVKAYLAIKEELYKDEATKNLIREFREKQIEIQNLMIQGKEAEQEQMEKLQSLYVTLTSNVRVKEFFDKEVAFDVLLSDIYKIMGEGLKEILD